MASDTPRKVHKRVNTHKGLKAYTYRGCPMTNNRTPWCFKLCTPNTDGIGFCGRVAPHGFKSRIQQGIEDYKKQQADASTGPLNPESNSNKDA